MSLFLSLSLFPSLPRAWSKCWNCALHDIPGMDHHHHHPRRPSPSTRYHRASLVPVRPQAPTPSTVPAVALSVSLHRYLVASSTLLPRRRTPLELRPPALPCQPPSASFPPPRRSSSSISSVVSVQPQSETRPLGISPSLASLIGREYAVCLESCGSRRIVAQLERDGRREETWI